MKRQEFLNEVWVTVFNMLDCIEEFDGDQAGALAQAAVDAIDNGIDKDIDVFHEMIVSGDNDTHRTY